MFVLWVPTDLVAQSRLNACCPFPRTDLSYGMGLRNAKRGKAVEHSSPNL